MCAECSLIWFIHCSRSVLGWARSIWCPLVVVMVVPVIVSESHELLLRWVDWWLLYHSRVMGLGSGLVVSSGM